MTGPAPFADPRGGTSLLRFGRIQRVVATRMSKSHAEIPDFSMSVDADLEALLARREELPADDRPSLNDLVLKAVASALRRHPKVNSSCRAEGIEIHARVNVGMAVATPDGGLLVVTVFDADTMSVHEIARRTRELSQTVRRGSIALADLEGATFTVSNLGMFGVDRMVPIVIPDQVGILGVGAARPRVVPTDQGVAVRRIATLTLAGDHRVLNGTDGAGFLDSIRSDLERPEAVFGGETDVGVAFR